MKTEIKGTIRCPDCGRKFGDHFEGKIKVKCYSCNTMTVFDTSIPEQEYALQNNRAIVGRLDFPAKK